MKKIIIAVLAIFTLVSSTMAIFAEDTAMKKNDSQYIGEQIKSRLDLKTTENVIVIYSTSVLPAFCDFNNIDEILKNDEYRVEEIYTIMSDDDIISYQTLTNNKLEIMTNYSEHDKKQDKKIITNILSNKTTQKNILSNAKINNIYYLSDCTYDGSFVYFATDKGDYVYYQNSYLNDTNEYLLPLKEFREFATEVVKDRRNHPDRTGGVDISSIFDLSPYAVNISNKVNVALIVGFVICGIIICGVITVGILILYKRKREIKNMNAI